MRYLLLLLFIFVISAIIIFLLDLYRRKIINDLPDSGLCDEPLEPIETPEELLQRLREEKVFLEEYVNSDYFKTEGFVNPKMEPTCNRDKIFRAIRDLEDKIDSLEYDIYKQNQKLKKYDESFLKYQQGEAAMKKAATEQQQKVASELKNKLEEEMKSISGGDKVSSMSPQEFQKKSQNIEKLSSQLDNETKKIGQQTSGLSATTPEGQSMVNLFDTVAASGTATQANEIQQNVNNLNLPPGLL